MMRGGDVPRADGEPVPTLRLTRTEYVALGSLYTVVQFFKVTSDASAQAPLRTVIIRELVADGLSAKHEIRLEGSTFLALVLVRPGAFELIQRIVDRPDCLLGVWTAGERDYALALWQCVMQAGVQGRPWIALSRRQCFHDQQGRYVKPLSRVFARWPQFHSGNTLLIDDQADVGGQYPKNVMQVDDFAMMPCTSTAAEVHRQTVSTLAMQSGHLQQSQLVLQNETPLLEVSGHDVLVGRTLQDFLKSIDQCFKENRVKPEAAYAVPNWTAEDLALENR